MILCSHPSESVVESMGSIQEHIKNFRKGSKSSTTKSDVKDVIDELIIPWNGPSLPECGRLLIIISREGLGISKARI